MQTMKEIKEASIVFKGMDKLILFVCLAFTALNNITLSTENSS